MILKGIPASPGLVYGQVFLRKHIDHKIEVSKIEKNLIPVELTKLDLAIKKTKEEITSLYKKVLEDLGEKHAKLFDAYTMILEDPVFLDQIKDNIKHSFTAESSLHTVAANMRTSFKNIENSYLRERERDILDLITKITANLKNDVRDEATMFDKIIVAHNLTPSDTMSIKSKSIRAFVTDIGGRTSHTAILAQALQIPAVVGLHDISKNIESGDKIIVDGYKGLVIINPTKKELEDYELEKRNYEQIEKKLSKIKNLPAITKDKVKVNLMANIEISEEIKTVLLHGASGIGLFRTEFLYVDRENFPSEEEQFEKYKLAAESMNPHPVIIRTIDIGGDKFLESLGIEAERNPFLGLRGIRFSLKRKDLFETQIRAILRASVYGNIKIMFPMISSLEEFIEAKNFVKNIKKSLLAEGVKFYDKIQIGAMIEVPSAALTIDLLAEKADFFSIGTNDLLQYLFAVDRADENVSNLYKTHHIAILRMLKFIFENSQKEVSICGEMAGDDRLLKILLGIGFRSLSMNPLLVPKIKALIREISIEDCKKLAQTIFATKLDTEILEILNKAK